METKFALAQLSWMDVEQRLVNDTRIVRPLGATEEHMEVFAKYFGQLFIEHHPPTEIARKVAELRQQFRPQYCYGPELFQAKLSQLCAPFLDEGSSEASYLIKLLYR